jgi:hypothetical protein
MGKMGAHFQPNKPDLTRVVFDKRRFITPRQVGLGVFFITVAIALSILAIPVGATTAHNSMSHLVMGAVRFPSEACLNAAQLRSACDSVNSENISPAWGTSDDVILLIGAAWLVGVGALLLIQHVHSRTSRV